ncbi:hypothetical protein K2173_002616 [Erythroxylum novogranatense]|uniref:Gustatory receptor n=1 Tax=Erythroxylum novogranatense TaxID=1862640 RepID=A0AAV8SWS0_9ROSI|nr:hypothetical protein K2173_002616 [Erythroxylum novogranatense]
MADSHVQVDQSSTAGAPLLNRIQNHNHQRPPRSQERANDDVVLDRVLQKLETFLSLLGFKQSSVLWSLLSWAAFAVVGVLLPIGMLELSSCSECEKYHIEDFELDILAMQACLAAVSLLCLTLNVRKYGVRSFILADRYSGPMTHSSSQYVQQIKNSLQLFVFWSLTCLLLKIVREIVRISYVHHESWWLSSTILLGLIISWTYLSTIYILATILFHLICNLQVVHFDDYAKLLERESDISILMEEHIRLRYNLSKISHRYRMFLLLQFCVVTASQCVTLLQTTGYRGRITIINGGDFAVSSIVQVVGIILCLHAAIKISHRAQGIASLAGRWHALATCSVADVSQLRVSSSVGNLEAMNGQNCLQISYSENDLESLDYMSLPVNTQLTSQMSSYHKRQAFVMYLQNNPGGITIFGWRIDRGLMNTIFFIELSLVTFVLGKTIVFTSK